MKDLSYIKPFRLFIKTNFPFIEATYEALDNYGLLCKVIEYLNNVIKNENDLTNNFNELLELFNNLLEETTNEFEEINNRIDTLNLQEYVDNRLDELVESGELENIVESFFDAQKIYFTFQDVINNTANLVRNQKIKTLGYKTINDGGAAEYIIKDEKNSTDLYIDLSENLFAQLILDKNEVNINSLGIDNTGTNDASVILNNVIEKINNNWLSNKFDVNTILLNGTYLLENQVKLSPFVKLRGTGYVTILTNVPNDAAIHISYLTNVSNPTNFAGDKLDWLYSELINFEKGGIIKNIGNTLENICIKIGTDTDWGEFKAISRYMLKNFRISNYNIGILHNRYHNYMGKFENISFEKNNIGVQYGTAANQTVVDSGENMTYINCLFSTNENAVKWFTDGFDSSFEMCSFDFLNDVFIDSSNLGYKKISCNQCHFEGFRSSIFNTLKLASMLIITSSTIVDNANNTARRKIFKNLNTSPKNIVVFENNKYILPRYSISDPEKLYFDLGMKIKMHNFVGVEDSYVGFLLDNNILGNVFDSFNDGIYTNTTGSADSQFNNIKFEYNANIISNQFEIRTDNYIYEGHKSLVLKSNSDLTTSKTIIMTTDFIDVSNYTLLTFNDFTNNMKYNQSSYTINYYDTNKNLIKTSTPSHYMFPTNPKLSNEWYSSSYCVSQYIPANCKFIKITVGYGNINSSSVDPIGTEYKIGGIVINGI